LLTWWAPGRGGVWKQTDGGGVVLVKDRKTDERFEADVCNFVEFNQVIKKMGATTSPHAMALKTLSKLSDLWGTVDQFCAALPCQHRLPNRFPLIWR